MAKILTTAMVAFMGANALFSLVFILARMTYGL